MKSVLIVDDSIAVARQLEKIVNSDDAFEVVAQGRNGAEAIKLCQQHKPDIVCMDMNMPVMDGLTALRNLMQLTPDLKVVMVTSLGGVGDKYTEAIRLGAKDVISKPFEKDNVLEMLKRL
ncbi:two-component system, chemotaxis family, response regulator CheY [Malonomonas rubra DSM 5091]|uniref:Two-component system, chemotaxis family, response regulator CheY n=1 Tax=Malonomonas rubra DSM 5091 TaxID=1122189 RepID=A0A1M6MXU0_MALRU|nr:response regulator [Malonomonas rubra]SHJ88266.1 two-component system, chemotaxis family, response regulator CheY [Malonomonas rubra DSM 5091]